MKTLFKSFAYAAIAALALSSCAKEKLQPADELTGKLVTVHFGTENTDPSTKATLTPDAGETAFQAAWENNDQISIEYISPDANTDIIVGIWDATNKKFSASLPNETGSWAYSAAYPVPSVSDNSVDFGANRTQKGNAYNSKYDIMIGAADTKNSAAGKDDNGKDIVFPMTRQTAIAYFHFTSDIDESLVSATLKVKDGAIANSAASISDFRFVAPLESDETEIKLTFEDGTAPSANDFQLWFNVLPTYYTSMTLTVETATKTFTISKNSEGKYEAGKLYKVKKDGISWTDKVGSVTPSVVTDVITADKLAAESTGYTDFSGVKISSNAVYAGQRAKSANGGIQLRSKYSNSGIVTTVSGGNARKISIVTESGTNTIDIYGKASPYEDATKLYATGNGDQGTKLGSLKCGTDTELVIQGDYPYIGIRSNSGAVYLTSITITWESGSSEPAPCETPVITLEGAVATVTCATEGATIRYTLDESDPTETSKEYLSPVKLTDGQTIKAKAFLEGHKSSEVVSKKYTASPGGELTQYSENFSNYENTATLNTAEVSEFNGDACKWSGIGATTAYYTNTDNSEGTTGVTLLKPASNSSTYIISEQLQNGVSKVEITAHSNNTSASLKVYVVTATKEILLGEVKTTSKKTKFSSSWDVNNISGSYQIKIANENTAAYINFTGLKWTSAN